MNRSQRDNLQTHQLRANRSLMHEEICDALSISRDRFERWTHDKRKAKEEEIKQTIFDMWLRCHTQEEIADVVGLSQPEVNSRIAENIIKRNSADSDIFRNFEPELYSVWNFAKATNEVKHFGNIPPEICDNLLYYYTQPGDVIFDPFGGGGSTLDMCEKRKRRCYISDLNPIPARERDAAIHTGCRWDWWLSLDGERDKKPPVRRAAFCCSDGCQTPVSDTLKNVCWTPLLDTGVQVSVNLSWR